MKQSLSDLIVSYLLKGGVLFESKGEVETEIDIPIGSDGVEKNISIRIKCIDLTIRTVKESTDRGA